MRALGTWTLLILAGCAGGDDKDDSGDATADRALPERDPGPEGHAYTSYAGRTRFQWAYDADPDARSCDLYWDTTGTASEELCPDCIWAFDLALTYDEAGSVAIDDCLDDIEDPNLEWTVGLSLTYYTYDVSLIWYLEPESAYWYPLFYAAWDYPTLYFGGGYYEYEYLNEGGSMYYTLYWSAEAEVR